MGDGVRGIQESTRETHKVMQRDDARFDYEVQITFDGLGTFKNDSVVQVIMKDAIEQNKAEYMRTGVKFTQPPLLQDPGSSPAWNWQGQQHTSQRHTDH